MNWIEKTYIQTIDFSRLKTYSEVNSYSKITKDVVVHYQPTTGHFQGTNIWYIVAKHKKLAPQSQTWKLIDAIKQHQTIDCAIIEVPTLIWNLSYPEHAGIKPFDVMCKDLKNHDFYWENIHAYYTFTGLDLPIHARPHTTVINGEDDAQESIKSLLTEGHMSALDIITYLCYDKTQHEMPLQTTLKRIRAHYGPAHYGPYLPIDFNTITENMITSNPHWGSWVAEHDTVMAVRDKHMLKKLFAAAKQYKNIVVVYGYAHWSTQKDVLEQSFGAPISIKNYEKYIRSSTTFNRE